MRPSDRLEGGAREQPHDALQGLHVPVNGRRRIQHRRIIDLKTGLTYSPKKAAGASRYGGYIAIN